MRFRVDLVDVTGKVSGLSRSASGRSNEGNCYKPD